jgi:hypothetical protein
MSQGERAAFSISVELLGNNVIAIDRPFQIFASLSPSCAVAPVHIQARPIKSAWSC